MTPSLRNFSENSSVLVPSPVPQDNDTQLFQRDITVRIVIYRCVIHISDIDVLYFLCILKAIQKVNVEKLKEICDINITKEIISTKLDVVVTSLNIFILFLKKVSVNKSDVLIPERSSCTICFGKGVVEKYKDRFLAQ